MKTLLLLCVVAIVPVACTPGDQDFTGQTAEGKKAMMRIVLGEGGGITGTWEGYTITGDGAVYAWKGGGARENELEIGLLPADTVGVFWDVMKELSTVPPVVSSGSLVRFLSVTMQDSTLTYSWKPQLGTKTTKAAYQELFDRCNAAIGRSMKYTKDAETHSLE